MEDDTPDYKSRKVIACYHAERSLFRGRTLIVSFGDNQAQARQLDDPSILLMILSAH